MLWRRIGSGVTSPPILNVDTRRKRSTHASAALSPGIGPPVYKGKEGWVSLRAGLDTVVKRKILPQPGTEPRLHCNLRCIHWVTLAIITSLMKKKNGNLCAHTLMNSELCKSNRAHRLEPPPPAVYPNITCWFSVETRIKTGTSG
jgi:hypothetical protein